MGAFELRAGAVDDRDFLARMLYEAAHWRPSAERPSQDEALRRPELSRYVAGWGREGDRALIATDAREPVAAAWYRLFPADEPGYGFVDETVPEVSMAVVPSHRRLGVGRAVLSALLVQAQLDDHLAVSLSVEDGNPALRLYEQVGFDTVEAREGGRTMIMRFALR